MLAFSASNFFFPLSKIPTLGTLAANQAIQYTPIRVGFFPICLCIYNYSHYVELLHEGAFSYTLLGGGGLLKPKPGDSKFSFSYLT